MTSKEMTWQEAWSSWRAFAEGQVLAKPATACLPTARQLCYTVLVHEGLGTLPRVASSTRDGWQRRLSSCQDAGSGCFALGAGEANASGQLAGTHTRPAMLDTFLALHALDALGARAPFPLHFMDRFAAHTNLAAWQVTARGFDERAILPFFLIYRAEVEQVAEARLQFHQTLDWLEESQHVTSGLWGPGAERHSLDSVLITAHLLPYFDYVYRPVSRVTRLLDTVLEYREPDRSLVGIAGHDPTVDLAFVNLLAVLSQKITYRASEVQNCLNASLQAIGRKAEAAVAGAAESEPALALDVLATFAYLSALAAIQAACETPRPALPAWEMRRWPGPGYLRPFDTLAQGERETLRAWQRPLPDGRQRVAGESITPRISVVIPCYNLGRYLYEAIDSVLAQTNPDVEILVVDDGSNDGFTRFLLSQLEHPQLQILYQENQGVAAARNHGIRRARSPYICCLDPDDRVNPAFFEEALRILEAGNAVGVVSGELQLFDERNGTLSFESAAFPELLVENRVVEPAVFRREAWEKAGGYRTFSHNGIEDWDLWITMVEAGYTIELIPEVVWYYRIRAAQMSEQMYEPETWGLLARELMLAHEASYRRYLPDVIATHAARWSSIRGWTLEQERALVWWTTQSKRWEQAAQERAHYIQELRDWITELEADKSRLEEQIDGVGAPPPDSIRLQPEGPWRRLQQYLRGRSSVRHD